MANILERLTEGTVFHDKKKETQALVSKWEDTGLLEGLEDDYQRGAMSVLLENQAKELLREANTMAGGDVQGFASVAFPIVRRVFAGLIANDLVSVQPMSLPNGLIFFMDFRHGNNLGFDADPVRAEDESLFGDRVGRNIKEGVRVDGNEFADKGFRNLTSGYGTARMAIDVTGTKFKVFKTFTADTVSGSNGKYVRFDPDISSEGSSSNVLVVRAESSVANLGSYWDLVAEQDLTSLSMVSGSVETYDQTGGTSYPPGVLQTGDGAQAGAIKLFSSTSTRMIRRLTRIVEGATGATDDVVGTKYLEIVFVGPTTDAKLTTACAAANLGTTAGNVAVQFHRLEAVTSPADALGALKGGTPWTLEGSSQIPEIELKVDSFSIVARSRKLRASWTPELGQDLNAYHNLDAEVELTSILSEQIGLEIDQEILNDLVKGQTAGVRYWSRRPGNFVNRATGLALATDQTSAVLPPDFTGNVSQWYETLLETVNDVSALIHRKTLRGGANFLVVSPEVANILEFTAGFRATVTHDTDKGSTGAVKVGAINSKWDVIVDPYFPRNVILVGRKGGSFLESGYVYAPYVPLQTTPTIFDPNTFVPRKAVMTRYGKAMVRPDMYGLVVVQDLLG